MTEKRERCPAKECGAYGGHHHPMCPLASVEYKAEQYRGLWPTCEAQIQRLTVALRRQRDLTTFWVGKFEILRRENNALRRKLAALQAKADEG